jgi:cytochrome b561
MAIDKTMRTGSGMVDDRTVLPQPYGTTAKSLHWLIVALVLTQFVISVLMPDIGPETTPNTVINLHFSFGLLILALMAVRLIDRLRHPVPLVTADAPEWERSAARAAHLLFYFILLIGPFLGWASASAHRLPVRFFGIVSLPDIAAPKARWALTAGDIHIYTMWTLLGLIAVHAAAALYHHWIKRDRTLKRMLPGVGG